MLKFLMNTPTRLHSPSKHNLSQFVSRTSSSDKFPKKGIDKKLLTPCRRVGLKRKSLSKQCASDSIPESSPVTNISFTSERNNFSVGSDNLDRTENYSVKNVKISLPKSGLFCSENNYLGNTVPDASENNCTSTTFSLENQLGDRPKNSVKNVSSKQKNVFNNASKLSDNVKIKPDSITISVLDSLANSIRDKREKFKHVELTNRYAKKHDLKMLEELTLKWKKGCQDALYELQTLLHDKGHNISMAAILNQFHIPFDVLQFNEDADEFD